MKKWLVALSTLAAFTHTAFAKSNFAVFGVIDTGLDYTSNAQAETTPTPGTPGVPARIGASQINLSGVMHGSRLGLRGTQELSQGWKAVFLLENGFEVNDGRRLQNDRLFGRQVYGGLQNDLGTATIGRQYDSMVDFLGPLAAGNKWTGGIATHIGDLDNLNNSRRVNRAIKYTSVNHNGLTFGGLYSLGGVPGSPTKNQIWSAGASYANGPLNLAAAYLNIRNPNLSFYEVNASGDGNNLGKATPSSLDINPSYAGYASARTLQIMGIGSTYAFGKFIAGLLYTNVQFKNLNDSESGPLATTNPNGYRGNVTFNNLEASLAYRFTPQLGGMVAYNYFKSGHVTGRSPSTQATFTTGATYHQVNLGLNYLILKGTDVYWLTAYQHASGIDSTGQRAVSAIMGVRPSNANHQVVMRIGLRHRF